MPQYKTDDASIAEALQHLIDVRKTFNKRSTDEEQMDAAYFVAVRFDVDQTALENAWSNHVLSKQAEPQCIACGCGEGTKSKHKHCDFHWVDDEKTLCSNCVFWAEVTESEHMPGKFIVHV